MTRRGETAPGWQDRFARLRAAAGQYQTVTYVCFGGGHYEARTGGAGCGLAPAGKSIPRIGEAADRLGRGKLRGQPVRRREALMPFGASPWTREGEVVIRPAILGREQRWGTARRGRWLNLGENIGL